MKFASRILSALATITLVALFWMMAGIALDMPAMVENSGAVALLSGMNTILLGVFILARKRLAEAVGDGLTGRGN